MQERHTNRESYFEEQARTTRQYYIPYILEHIGKMPDRVLEIGCGEGGNLLPFAENGCEVVGVDLASSRIDQARTFFSQRNVDATFIASDIFLLDNLRSRFSLIVIHDVIEHIDNKERFLSDIKDFLAPDGVIFIAFPPWQMPFGGHQQIAHSRLVSHFPFLHLLPTSLYRATLRLCREPQDVQTELLNIKRTQCPIELFLRVVRQTHYQITGKQLYFINPHYETKFGLTPRKLNKVIASIAHLRNFFCTSCFFILKRDR